MADLGSKSALDTDLDGKVTTNGANQNTGLRVRTFLHNLIDTLYALIGRDIAPTTTFSTTTNTAQDPGQDTVRFNNATIASVTEIALSDVVGGVDKGDLNSRFTGIIQFRPVGTTDTIEFQITSVVHTSWTRYTVTYLKGTLPANGTVMAVRFLPSNTINAALAAALAGKADKILQYKWIGVGGSNTGAIAKAMTGVTINVTNPGTGSYRFSTASGTPFTVDKTTVTIEIIDGSAAFTHGYTFSTDQIEVFLWDAFGVAADPSGYQVTIEVEQ